MGTEPGFEAPYLYPDYRATVLRAPSQKPVRLPGDWFHVAHRDGDVLRFDVRLQGEDETVFFTIE